MRIEPAAAQHRADTVRDVAARTVAVHAPLAPTHVFKHLRVRRAADDAARNVQNRGCLPLHH